MALLKFLKGNYASLNNAAIAEGQVLICGDTGEMFVDVAADKRVKIGDFVVVDTLANLEALDATSVPTSRLYYVEDGNILARSNGTGWIQINKQRTAEEVKTLIGLANYETKSDASAKLDAAKGYTDAEVKKVSDYVGTLPEDTTATTVVELVTMAQDAADEAQKDVDELAGKVGTVQAGKTIVQMIADAQTAATYDDTEVRDLISDNAEAIALLNNSAETEGSVDYKIAQAIAGVMENPDETMNSIQELVTWTQGHAKDALELSNQVSANKTALETLNGGEEVTGSVAAAVKAEKDRAVAKENELAKAIADQATSDANTYETKTDASGKLAEAKKHADDLNTAMNTRVEALEAIDHEHSNKELLDTYTQTEANLADAVAKKHSHANQTVLDGITSAQVTAWDAAEGNAKSHADSKVQELANGAVATNTAAIATLNGTVEEAGSVAKTVADAVKAEADRAKEAEKANADAILLKANTADVYAKTETYTKTEIEALLTWGSF